LELHCPSASASRAWSEPSDRAAAQPWGEGSLASESRTYTYFLKDLSSWGILTLLLSGTWLAPSGFG
jgi:hypothetical protein